VSGSDDPILVTTAPISPRDERRGRERRYLITMAIRVIAIILALVLPWIAVVLANAGPNRRTGERPSLYAGKPPRELE
jgi:hypothetical protein